MPIIITDINQLNSVQFLIEVQKAVYVMKSNVDNNLYRFGAIGLRYNLNTALWRLGQCAKVEGQNIQSCWRYIAIAKFDADNLNQIELRQQETALRGALVDPPHGTRQRMGRTDSFTCNDCAEILAVFTEVWL